MSGAWTQRALSLPGMCYHSLEALSRGPPAQPSFLRFKPTLCLDGVSKGKQNEGQSKQVTRRAPSISVRIIRRGALWSGLLARVGWGIRAADWPQGTQAHLPMLY